MTDKERIEKAAIALAAEILGQPPVGVDDTIVVGYIAGATAEHEYMAEQLKQERNKVQELRDELKKFSKALVTRDGNLTSKLLIEERERLMTVIEYAFVAGRGKTSWAQFKKDHEI